MSRSFYAKSPLGDVAQISTVTHNRGCLSPKVQPKNQKINSRSRRKWCSSKPVRAHLKRAFSDNFLPRQTPPMLLYNIGEARKVGQQIKKEKEQDQGNIRRHSVHLQENGRRAVQAGCAGLKEHAEDGTCPVFYHAEDNRSGTDSGVLCCRRRLR